jgi:hypothetical protein
LLFAGTESGMYVSYDDGSKWESLQLNLPVSPVNDLVVKNKDLVVATHGRSFWVLDDITPLEQYSDTIPQEEAHLFTPAAANHTVFRGGFFGGGGNTGKNPPAGAVIDYWLKTSLKKPEGEKKDGEKKTDAGTNASGSDQKADAAKPESKPADAEAPKVTLDILDSSGKVIRHFPKKEEEADAEEGFIQGNRAGDAGKLPADAGLNRFVWDLNYEAPPRVPHAPLWAGRSEGPKALPGQYQVRLTVLGKSYTAPLEITPDPRLKVPQADLQKQFDLLVKIRDKFAETNDAINQIRDFREQINAINKRLKGDSRAKSLADAGKGLDKKMTEVEEALIQTKAKSGQDVLNFPIRLNNHLAALASVVASADSAPTKQSYEIFDMLSKSVDDQLAKWKTIVSGDVRSYNDLIKQQEVPALLVKPPEVR